MAYKTHKQFRKQGYDYSQNGAYHIMVVTKNRQHFLGEIEDDRMILSEIGEYVASNFLKIENEISYLTITERQIMPDHIHMIIVIDNISDKIRVDSPKNNHQLFPLHHQSISLFMNHFKGTVKKWCNLKEIPFNWQAKFHDRIIRNQREYDQIAAYIQNNILNWWKDKPA